MRDVAVIGGGHNGLVCAAYLAAAGLDVEVLEANDDAGGCIWTEALDSGHRLERGAVDLTMIDDVVADLHLTDHGLHLLDREILVGAGFGDGARLLFHSDLEATIDGWGGIGRADRESYRSFADLAARAVDAFDALPGVPAFGEVIRLAESLSTDVDLARLLVSSAESVIGRRIRDGHLAGAVAMYGAHGQLPPWLPGTGLFALMLPGSHGSRSHRPRGGAGAFIDAIASALEASGGTLRTNARVVGIDSTAEGAVIRLEDGEFVAARRVMSSLDIRRTVHLLGDPPPTLRSAAEAVQSGALNIGELKIDLALSAPATIVGGDADAALWLLQERSDSLHTSFGEIIAGRMPGSPAMMWAAPSVLDPTAAPDGGGTVWLSAFVPVRLRDRSWDGAAEEQAVDGVLDGFARITGIDLRPITVDRRVLGPAGWERRIGAPGGNPNHLDLTLDQLFDWRPPGARGYRTELPWLYLTGAGTFPGGGVSGLPGRNAAQALLADLGAPPRRVSRWRREIKGLWDAFGLYRSMRRSA
ncbi:MAG: NAD(P)/FAD-dependent oxidoreductase [Actinobacteria bacterium]|nr:NAD(P)/FAD-dependent oxidoreductase [Actinomycetota bacterium]